MAASTESVRESNIKLEMSSETEQSTSFAVGKCAVEKVVVYQDRAEVCRIIETTLKKGENEVIVTGLSQFVDEDSIRVEGKGSATILEVTFETKFSSPSDAEKEERNSRAEELLRELEAVNSKLAERQAAKARVDKQWTVLDQFSSSITKMGASIQESDAKTTVTKLDKTQLEGITEFFKLYDSHGTRLDTSLLDLTQQTKKLEEEKMTVQKNMRQLGIQEGNDVSRQCSILLESQEPEEVKITLLVSYVISQACWTPKYDIRVFPEEKKLKVMYYGLIQQSTDEDWEDAKLFLSTAMPSIGGTIPTLGRSSVKIKRAVGYSKIKTGRPLSFRSKKLRPMYASAPGADMLRCAVLTDDSCVETMAKGYEAPMMSPQSEAKEGLTSTTFEITRNASIPSDNVGHKVTVGIIDLVPEFEYESIPVLAPHAFLKAKVTNKSQYAFLPGPTNIFLDNNFVAKSELSAVSPAEEFLVSLGVDPAVRITYKPLNKFQEMSGLLSRVKTVTHKQDIEVKNTHTDAIHIKLVDQVPLSAEDKVKVNIIEPMVSTKHPEKVENTDSMKLTKDNHVEWQLTVKGGEKREITLKYTIECPAGEEVDITTN